MTAYHELMEEGERHGAYVGDGVYVSFDGEHVWLRTRREHAVHEIGLAPEVWNELKLYVETKIMTEEVKP
jgi:hypothetical protein